MDLWGILRSYVESGQEDEKVELKQEVTLSTKADRAEFARDISALANTSGAEGYMVIGVVDARKRVGNKPADYVVGFWYHDKDEFRRLMNESVSLYCDPPPKVTLSEFVHPATGRPMGVIIVARSFARPHVIKRSSGDIQAEEIWVRRGPACVRANRDEIEEMFKVQRRVTVINLSHPLTDRQQEMLRLTLNCSVQQVIDRPVQLDHEHPFAEQVRELIDSVGLTSHAWQTAPIVVNLPGLSSAAATVVAELNGRMGYFPTIIRLRPVSEHGTTEYEFAEVLDLQWVRDQSRERR